jgi:hypothetical protein
MRWLGCAIAVWASSAGVVHAMPGLCGTPEFLDMTLASVQLDVPPPPPGPAKGTREAHGACAGSDISENFILKWGANAPPNPDEVEQILLALERSWDSELNVMGHAQPSGSDTHLFNVYFGDSGDCAPSAFGMGGYYTTDPEGWPMIVLSNGVFDDGDYGRTTVAHEFYHAVQHAEGSFANSDDARWWWEATAMWVESVVYPSTTDYYTFLHGYAFQPHRQLNSYTYPENGVLEEYHQYGAGIWPRYLTEFEADWSLIRDSWSLSGPDDDPVEVIRDLLESDLDQVFADFAAHNAVWDYFHGDGMEEWLNYMEDVSGFGSQDARIVDTVVSGGTSTDWQTPPQETLPERYGYNVIRMSGPNDGTMVVRFRGEATGSQASEARWLIRVVREKPSGIEYEELVVIDGEGQLTLRDVGPELAIYLVVTVSSPAWRSNETFEYTYQMDMGAPSSTDSSSMPTAWSPSFNDPDSSKGWACSSAAAPWRAVWWWLPLVGLIRRRRD